MANLLLLTFTLAIGLAIANPLVYRKRIVFPGPEYHPTQNIRFPAHQEAASTGITPYPAAGFKPGPPFELPTKEAAYFPEPNFETPDEIYGPPPSAEIAGILKENPATPQLAYGVPEQTYGVPELQSFVPSATPELIDQHEFFPKTELTLPLVERLTVFRSEPKRRPPPTVIQREIKNPLKLTKEQRRSTRPVVNPSKITATLHHKQAQQAFAQLQPIIRHRVHLPDGTITYSERPQSW